MRTIKHFALSFLLMASLWTLSFCFVLSPSSRHSYRTTIGSSTALAISTDPAVEAELCSTMAHLALDFTGFLSPSRSMLRLFAIIGRLFAISADYLPDHTIHPEELVIQIFLLSLALRGRH